MLAYLDFDRSYTRSLVIVQATGMVDGDSAIELKNLSPVFSRHKDELNYKIILHQTITCH